jgi:hypothetical protein
MFCPVRGGIAIVWRQWERVRVAIAVHVAIAIHVAIAVHVAIAAQRAINMPAQGNALGSQSLTIIEP